MRRPLAALGFCFLLTLLAATRLPAGFLFPLGLVCVALCVAALFFFRRGAKAYLPLLLASAGLALLFRAGYDYAVVRPVLALDGGELPVTARVEDTQPGYGEDLYTANLTVLELDGEPQKTPLKLQVYSLPEAAIGDVITLDLRFYDNSDRDSSAYLRGKGIYIGASAASAPVKTGEDMTFLCTMRQLKYTAGDNIRQRLPLRLSSVAAAMAVGDKRTLSEQTIAAYRMAGLSHMLVVSGLHLSVVSGAVYALCRALTKRRRLVSVFCMAAVFLFMAFTGLTPSILRSGIACLLVYLAVLFQRKADVYTSLGLAAVLLCLQNPYAAADAGLQLSFTATLGALAGGELATRLKRRAADKNHKKSLRALLAVGRAALVPVCVTLATLPAILLNSFGISLLSVPMNIIAVPLLAPIVLCGFVMALPGGVFLFDLLARPAAFIAGVLLVVLEKLTDFAASFPRLYVSAGGLFFLVAVLLAYALVALAVTTRFKKTYAVAAALILPLSLALHLALSADTVRITLAGSGTGSSLVVAQNGSAAVLYRSRLSHGAVQDAFSRQNLRDCVLLIDMRQTAQSTEYETSLHPRQVFLMDDLPYREIFTPLESADIYLQNQGDGRIACVDVEGYKVCIVTGGVDLALYTAVDVLVPGGGETAGDYGTMLMAGEAPEWADETAQVLHSGGSAELVIRPGQSVVFREAYNDILF